MKRRYKNPPIQEAVCEVHFELQEPFKVDDINTLGEVWKPSYPVQELLQEKNIELRFELGKENINTTQLGNRLIARSSDGIKLVQLNSRLLAINQLKPYPGWLEEYKSEVLSRISETLPILKVTRVGAVNLRYINRLDIPQRPLNWSEWFTVGLPLPPSVSFKGGMFQSHLQQDLDSALKATLAIATLPLSEPNLTSVVLDNMISWKGSEDISLLPVLLDQIHEPLPGIFFDLLTDQTQALIGGFEYVS